MPLNAADPAPVTVIELTVFAAVSQAALLLHGSGLAVSRNALMPVAAGVSFHVI